MLSTAGSINTERRSLKTYTHLEKHPDAQRTRAFRSSRSQNPPGSIHVEVPLHRRPAEGHVGDRTECGGGQVDVPDRARLAAVDDLHLDRLAAVRDGRGKRDVALRFEVAVEEAVAADVDELGAGDDGLEDAELAESFAAWDEGAADGVALNLREIRFEEFNE
jgi:hypothetical protein